ncbi:phosphoketolase family protein [Agromyces cerinus]|uniref:Xylulose-5-phosphate/fructose-6-phosphate phosphoketolase n=1 Tax=Agromyces cerinus subsp. cerinus TaxID=232089 RepID=A0A1N6F4N6_9MICO|nr:phosphoketolase family protein [Agromyces cerinus]SIN90243.1 xylulose-5-phosphate/fructose-6-phosphate phosphoketolase [Agromyces cerinus subsp. cerinus]
MSEAGEHDHEHEHEHEHEQHGRGTSVPLEIVDAWWRAANYLSVGQIYLMANPLLARPLEPADIKPRLLGHWGTSPGLNLVYTHLNRAIVERGTPTLYVCGPGHGGPAMVANTWLDGTYSELFPAIGTDAEGMRRLFRQFSFPGGIPSHAAPETPGSINEGGELGYSLMHAFGAALDNPGLVVACVVGDGEAETGPLAASWRGHSFLNPVTDGAVLPILHLNGYKIANPTLLARIPEAELVDFFRGNGYEPLLVTGGFDGEDPMAVHGRMADAVDVAYERIAAIRADAAAGAFADAAPRWPAIVLRTPKGWTGPRMVDGVQVEGTFRAHQVPLAAVRENPEHLAMLEAWLRSYRPEELFDRDGRPVADLDALRPHGDLRMSATPIANGGIVRSLDLPRLDDFALNVDPGDRGDSAESTRVLGEWFAELMRRNPDDVRLFGPDEVLSNRLGAVFDVTSRVWAEALDPLDEHLAREGRVIEALSEHLMQGMLEGYLLTGRHGLITSYEAFIHIVDSMVNQHAKWLESASRVPWRGDLASLNFLLSSHVWRQDHNGFSHQDPGFLNIVVNKQADVARVYLPPDANTLLAVMRHAFDTQNRVNVIVAGKQPAPQWLTLAEAEAHVEQGIGIWVEAGNEPGYDAADPGASVPDVVMACAGDVPTMETVAAAQLLRERLPDLRVRVVNVVDLMRLQDPSHHPHGLPDRAFDAMFTTDAPVIFAFHGYPSVIHQLTYRRANHRNLHVRGFIEKGTTTTPFDMLHLNDLDRYRLALDVLHRVPGLEGGTGVAEIADEWRAARSGAREYAYEHGEDPDWITAWRFATPPQA